jgi:hypothetical protein
MMRTMSRLSSAEVFTPTSYPTYTYVQRDDLHHERLLREWTRSSNMIASISGPSKAGKTVLVQRVCGEGNLITVSGASVRAPDQLWERVLDWWGEPHSVLASRVDGSTDSQAKDHGVQLGVTGTNMSHRASHVAGTTQTETLSATSNRRGLPQVVQELAGTAYTILLDDFHYIPQAIQADVAQQLKDAASRGLRICVASVPHRADNVVRALPELRGRVLAIDLDYWSRRDLLQIPKLGLPLLGLEIDERSLQMFAIEASGSPQLMQSICLWMCNHLGAHETAETPRAVELDELARKQILFLTSSTVDFRSLVRALIVGPKVKPGERKLYVHHDGRTGDVYLTIMRAVAMEPKLTIEKDELMRRLDALCNGASPDTASVVRACATLGQIAGAFAAPTGPSFEWDEPAQTLVIADPYLQFYLRWSIVLEREADALA